jgi:hypothetical protein
VTTPIDPARVSLKRRGTCSVCGGEYGLTATGAVILHDSSRWHTCGGSKRPPAALIEETS